jgi:hypothetical protein
MHYTTLVRAARLWWVWLCMLQSMKLVSAKIDFNAIRKIIPSKITHSTVHASHTADKIIVHTFSYIATTGLTSHTLPSSTGCITSPARRGRVLSSTANGISMAYPQSCGLVTPSGNYCVIVLWQYTDTLFNALTSFLTKRTITNDNFQRRKF